MANWRATAYFACNGAGWSHTWYLTENALTAAQKKFEIYIDKHMLMMSTQVSVIGYRISNVDDRRKSILVLSTLKGVIDSPADMPWTGILVELRTGNNDVRRIVLHGIPDEVTQQPWRDRPALAIFNEPYSLYRRFLLDEQFRVRIQRPSGVYHDISNIEINGAGKVQVTTVDAHAFSNNALVRFKGVRTVPSLTGTWRSAKVDATNFILPKTNLNHVIQEAKGSVKELLYDYETITVTQAKRPAKRDLGRPFDPQRGFKKTAKIHASP